MLHCLPSVVHLAGVEEGCTRVFGPSIAGESQVDKSAKTEGRARPGTVDRYETHGDRDNLSCSRVATQTRSPEHLLSIMEMSRAKQ